jgi:monoamine oxidase
LNAAQSLEFGHVVRVTIRFDEAFWEKDAAFRNLSFLLSQQMPFPTWWTPAPISAPVITGWSAGPSADPLIGRTKEEIARRAVECLEHIVNMRAASVCAAFVHDWQADPFSRGAYSYVPVNHFSAREALSQPVANTLFFAGEATDTDGYAAPVHGAIRSGIRAARQIIATRPRSSSSIS